MKAPAFWSWDSSLPGRRASPGRHLETQVGPRAGKKLRKNMILKQHWKGLTCIDSFAMWRQKLRLQKNWKLVPTILAPLSGLYLSPPKADDFPYTRLDKEMNKQMTRQVHTSSGQHWMWLSCCNPHSFYNSHSPCGNVVQCRKNW